MITKIKEQIIDKYFELYFEKKKIEDGNMHAAPLENEFFASSAGHCPRQIYYQKKLGLQDIDIRAKKIFILGDVTHEFIQTKIFPKGESEVRSNLERNGYIVRGRLDHIDDEFIWELKSISSLDYVRLSPKLEHVYQLMIYLHVNKRKHGKIVYIEKKLWDLVEHDVFYDPKIFEEAVESFDIVFNSIKSSTIPPILAKYKNDWLCSYCQYKEICDKTKG